MLLDPVHSPSSWKVVFIKTVSRLYLESFLLFNNMVPSSYVGKNTDFNKIKLLFQSQATDIRKKQVYQNVSGINIAYQPGMCPMALHLVISVTVISKTRKAVLSLPKKKKRGRRGVCGGREGVNLTWVLPLWVAQIVETKTNKQTITVTESS